MQHSSGCSEFLLMNHKTFICIEIAQSQSQKKLTWICVTEHTYRKVASSNRSRLEAQEGLFRLLMKGIFDPYVL